jgi:hypothetical protein
MRPFPFLASGSSLLDGCQFSVLIFHAFPILQDPHCEFLAEENMELSLSDSYVICSDWTAIPFAKPIMLLGYSFKNKHIYRFVERFLT